MPVPLPVVEVEADEALNGLAILGDVVESAVALDSTLCGIKVRSEFALRCTLLANRTFGLFLVVR